VYNILSDEGILKATNPVEIRHDQATTREEGKGSNVTNLFPADHNERDTYDLGFRTLLRFDWEIPDEITPLPSDALIQEYPLLYTATNRRNLQPNVQTHTFYYYTTGSLTFSSWYRQITAILAHFWHLHNGRQPDPLRDQNTAPTRPLVVPGDHKLNMTTSYLPMFGFDNEGLVAEGEPDPEPEPAPDPEPLEPARKKQRREVFPYPKNRRARKARKAASVRNSADTIARRVAARRRQKPSKKSKRKTR
jgi:hypothetical protein